MRRNTTGYYQGNQAPFTPARIACLMAASDHQWHTPDELCPDADVLKIGVALRHCNFWRRYGAFEHKPSRVRLKPLLPEAAFKRASKYQVVVEHLSDMAWHSVDEWDGLTDQQHEVKKLVRALIAEQVFVFRLFDDLTPVLAAEKCGFKL